MRIAHDENYILAVSPESDSDSEYIEFLEKLNTKPEPVEGKLTMLTYPDMTWVQIDDPSPDPEPDESEYAEAGRVLLGEGGE